MGALAIAAVMLLSSHFGVLAEPATTSARHAAVQEACAAPVQVDQLEQLLATGRVASGIDAVRIAQCRRDPALAGWLFLTALRSHVEVVPNDPDLGYRAVRSLQDLPFDAIVGPIEAVDLSGLIDGETERLANDWLRPLGALQDGEPPPMTEALRADLVSGLDVWRVTVLKRGPQGLASLDQDGERASLWVVDGLRNRYLSVLSDEGGALGAAAREARLQLGLADGDVPWPPPVHRSGHRPPPDLVVAPADEDRVVVAPGRGRTPGLVPLLVLLGLTAGWLAAARAWPERRRALFAVAALSLAPVAWLGAEAVLALAGAEAPIDARPSFNLGGAVGPGLLVRPTEIDGAPYLEIEGGSARPAVFEAAPVDGAVRIAVMGESSVFGADYLSEDAFATLLGGRLAATLQRPVEVINGGVGGVVSDEILQFTHQMLTTSPDLVVFYLGFNDLSPLSTAADHRAWSPATMALRGLSDRSRAVGALQRLGVRIGHAEPDPTGAFLDDRPTTPAERRRIGAIVEAMLTDNLTRMARAVRAAGAEPLIGIQGQPATVCRPESPSISTCFDEALRRAAVRAGRRAGATVVDLPAAIEDHRTAREGDVGEWDYYWDAVHPSRLGHRVLSEALVPAAAALLTEER